MNNKLSKNTIYAIKYLVSQGIPVEKISEELNVSIKNINSLIESENLTYPISKDSDPPKTAKDLMINQTAIKRTKSVAIMTQEASMLNDHNKIKYGELSKQQKHIFNPFQK